MSKTCAVCGKPLESGVVVHSECVQRWIPVTERLPQNADRLGAFCPKYQVATKFGITDGWYNPDDKCWYVLMWFMTGRFTEDNIDFERGDVPLVCRAGNGLVTHWMPLPEPPEVE